MAGGIDWFRWHHGSVTDPKFQLIARRAGASVAEVIAVWAFLLEQASQAEKRGHPGEMDFESIDCALGLQDGRAEAVYTHMADRGLLSDDGAVTAWERRQPKRERDDDLSSERVKAFRDRKRQSEPRNTDETPCNATERRETPRGEERRGEEGKALSGRPDAEPDSPAGLLAYLNAKAGKAFRPVESNLGRIAARLKTCSPDDVRAVIDTQVEKWGRDEKMTEYLRPETLFGALKFEGYLGNLRGASAHAAPGGEPDSWRKNPMFAGVL